MCRSSSSKQQACDSAKCATHKTNAGGDHDVDDDGAAQTEAGRAATNNEHELCIHLYMMC